MDLQDVMAYGRNPEMSLTFQIKRDRGIGWGFITGPILYQLQFLGS